LRLPRQVSLEEFDQEHYHKIYLRRIYQWLKYLQEHHQKIPLLRHLMKRNQSLFIDVILVIL